MAFEAGNHPNQRVKKIRYHYQPNKMRKKKNKITEGNGYKRNGFGKLLLRIIGNSKLTIIG